VEYGIVEIGGSCCGGAGPQVPTNAKRLLVVSHGFQKQPSTMTSALRDWLFYLDDNGNVNGKSQLLR